MPRVILTNDQANWYTRAIKAAKPATTRNTNAGERERLLDQAVHAGVISQGTRAAYARAYDSDPAGTKLFLGKIGLRAPGVQVTPSGDSGPATVSGPTDYGDGLLTDSEKANLALAREGKFPSIITGG